MNTPDLQVTSPEVPPEKLTDVITGIETPGIATIQTAKENARSKVDTSIKLDFWDIAKLPDAMARAGYELTVESLNDKISIASQDWLTQFQITEIKKYEPIYAREWLSPWTDKWDDCVAIEVVLDNCVPAILVFPIQYLTFKGATYLESIIDLRHFDAYIARQTIHPYWAITMSNNQKINSLWSLIKLLENPNRMQDAIDEYGPEFKKPIWLNAK